MNRPLTRPYARIERERRFALDRLPDVVDPNAFERYDDLFIAGTHLRLRRVTRPDGSWVITKLGQKIAAPEAPSDARQRQMTTIYLPRDEGETLSRQLAGLRSTKRRYQLIEAGHTFCIDVWEAPVELIVAEVETDSLDELAAIAMPPWAAREVTDDPSYSAPVLAARYGTSS